MADYSRFKKSFCECCDTNKKRLCFLGWPCSADKNRSFIDWEEVVGTKPAPQHDWPHCDSVYINSENTVYLIEFKNIKWFYDENTNKLKSLANIQEELVDKFDYSIKIFQEDGNDIEKFQLRCACDFNGISSLNKSIDELKRQLRNNFFIYLEQYNIYYEECRSLYYSINFVECP